MEARAMPRTEKLSVQTHLQQEDLFVVPQSPARSSSLLPPPSPSRPRVDPQYSARLQQYGGNSAVSATPSPSRKRRPSSHNSNNNYFFGSTVGGQMFHTPERKGNTINNTNSLVDPPYYFTPLSAPTTPTSSNTVLPPDEQLTDTNLSVDAGYSDRFIPSRVTSNLDFSLFDTESRGSVETNHPVEAGHLSSPTTTDAAAGSSSINSSHRRTNSHEGNGSQSILNMLLRSELIDENTYGARANLAAAGTSTQEHANLFRFRNSRHQSYQDQVLDDLTGGNVITSIVKPFNLSPMGSASSHLLLAAPQKHNRKIPKVPFKVLDAPALQDDFYLNLVDWSSANVLAVGLGSCVYLWSACTSKVTKLCDLSTGQDAGNAVTSVSWTQRGTHLAVGTNSGEVQLWDTVKCKLIRSMDGHASRVGALAWNGPLLASGSRDRNIYLRDARVQQSFISRLSCHKQEVCGLKWSFDEPSQLASGGNDNKLLVWDIKNHEYPAHRFSEHTAAVKAIAWSPHQHGLLASGGGTQDRCIRFWNTTNGTSLNCIDTGSQVCNLAWSKNCPELVSTHGYSLNQVVVWRYPSMTKVATLTGHTYRVLYLAMSPDGSTIVT